MGGANGTSPTSQTEPPARSAQMRLVRPGPARVLGARPRRPGRVPSAVAVAVRPRPGGGASVVAMAVVQAGGRAAVVEGERRGGAESDHEQGSHGDCPAERRSHPVAPLAVRRRTGAENVADMVADGQL